VCLGTEAEAAVSTAARAARPDQSVSGVRSERRQGHYSSDPSTVNEGSIGTPGCEAGNVGGGFMALCSDGERVYWECSRAD